jgi:MFS transporter, Spinster family, sphingosine-1-phosphate transporter
MGVVVSTDPPRDDSTPHTFTRVPGARAAVALLLSINLFNYIDRYVLAAVESKIATDLLPGDPNALAKMGSLATAFIISYMISAPIFGWLADRMSRWLLVGFGVTVWTLASGASGLAMTYTMLLVTRMFVGIGEGGYGPAAPTLIADLYPVERRGSVLAWFYMAIPVGSALGYMLGGGIASLAQGWHGLAGWRWPFIAVVPPGLLLGVMCFRKRDPPRGISDAGPGAAAAQQQHKATLRDYVDLFRIPSYVLDCAGMTAMTFAIGGIAFWMPRYISEVRGGGSLAHVNVVFGGITVLSGITATLLGGITGDRLRPRFPGSYFLVSGIGILIACPAIIAMMYIPFPAAWIPLFVAEFFLFFNTGPSNTILANVTKPHVRATGFALNILFIHALGDALSPPVLGWIAGRHSWNMAIYVVVMAMALAGVLWLWGTRYLQRDTLAATAPATERRGFGGISPQ